MNYVDEQILKKRATSEAEMVANVKNRRGRYNTGTQIILFTVQYRTFIHFLIYSELVLVIGLFIRFSTDSQCNIPQTLLY